MALDQGVILEFLAAGGDKLDYNRCLSRYRYLGFLALGWRMVDG